MFVEREFFIGFDDLMFGNKASNKAIIKHLVDMAGIHSNIVGYGLNDREKVGHTWILLAWKVELFRRPSYSETIRIKTWSRPMKSYYALRDFQIFDKEKKLIGIASSKWVFINNEKESLAKIPKEVADLYKSEDIQVFQDDDIGKLSEGIEGGSSLSVKVTRNMIDVNNHVNNIYYLDIVNESLPEDLYKKEYNKFEIMYKKEIKREYVDTTVNCICTKTLRTNMIEIKSADNKILHAIVKLSE